MQNNYRLAVLQVVPALDAGGVERTTIEIAQAIVQAGGRAYVASRGGRMEGDLRKVGGELLRLPMDSKTPTALVKNALALAAIGREKQVAIIHARSRAPAWSALWAARRLKVPFVTTYHGVYGGRTGIKRFYNSVMARGDLVIANSEYTRAHILDQHHVSQDRVLTIPRGVDLDVFDAAKITADRIAAVEAAWPARAGRRVVLLPARLTRWKGQPILIQAAAEVERRLPGRAAYIIAGDAQGRNDYVRELSDLTKQMGVADVVSLQPHIDDMPAAFLASDFAVFPSTEPEAFGRGAVEAQAMGRPVIVSGVGGMGETIVHGESGLHVAPGDVRGLADAIATFLTMDDDSLTAMGERGRTRIRADYSTESLQRATLAVYARLLGDRG